MERRVHPSQYELLHQDQYTPEEVAELLGMGIGVVRHVAFTGELRAQIIGHDIVSISRTDLLVWLRLEEGPERNQAPRVTPTNAPRSPGAGGDH